MVNKVMLDEKWFALFQERRNKNIDPDWFQQSVSISAEEKEQFLNNETENPEFTATDFADHKKHLLRVDEFRARLHKEEKDSVVLDLYERKLQSIEKRNALLEAFFVGDDKTFCARSCELYGKPKKNYFSYVAKQVTALCAKQEQQFPAAAKRLKRIVSKIDQSDQDISAGILPPLVTPGKAVASVDEVKRIFQETLDQLEITDWTLQVDVSTTRPRFSVDPFNRVVHIPNQAQLLLRPQKLTAVQIAALAEHEIGVHVRRAHEGSRGRLKLLQIGLDSYMPGEEGLAGYVQQQIEGADEFYGFDRYLAACLAYGMDGTKRDFRAVFSVMVDFYTLKYALEDTADAAALRAAWAVCLRIFRGTSGKTPGAIYTKDITYMEGNIGIWHLISDKPQVFESLFLGKFNPLLSRHVKSLQTLGILKEW